MSEVAPSVPSPFSFGERVRHVEPIATIGCLPGSQARRIGERPARAWFASDQ
jgi:hypothetical protein